MRIVQLQHPARGSFVAKVEDGTLRLIHAETAYGLARDAIERGTRLASLIDGRLSDETLDYDPVYELRSEWRLLPPFTHPEPARCLITGTGLTHKASADNRQAMHRDQSEMSDSMRMYLAGLEGGRPGPGGVGVAPEWFYKGCGTIVRAHGESLTVPPYAGDGGEEPEIAGIYVIDDAGRPRRVGMTAANEFSDHVLEKTSYLYLAHSKLRACSLGPELVIDVDFSGSVDGNVAIERGGETVWSQAIASGEANMSHSVANLEHHHFKYEAHRRPGDAHVHFFGADAFSFGAGVQLADGDVMVVAFEGFGRALRNPIRIEGGNEKFIAVEPL